MAELAFSVDLKWQGTGREGEGTAQMSEERVHYSAPASMGGKGVGTSPEELLLAAVASCYSGTLFGVLRQEGLPVETISVRAEGSVTGYPVRSKFAVLRVNPTIHGGESGQMENYRRLAHIARDKCFIGKTIIGNVAYEVGYVSVLPE